MFEPIIKPILKKANFGPNIFVKPKEIKTNKTKIIDVKSILFLNYFRFTQKIINEPRNY